MTIEIPNWIIYTELVILGIAVTSGLIVAAMHWMSWLIERRRIWSCFTFLITKRVVGVEKMTVHQLRVTADNLREERPEVFERAKEFFS